MKFKLCSLMIAAVLLMTVLSGCTLDDRLDAVEDRIENRVDVLEDSLENTVTSANDTAPATAGEISQAQAEQIALDYAGFTADQVQRMHTEYEIDDRIPQYDVQFYANNVEYEFEINAQTGDIISFDRDT